MSTSHEHSANETSRRDFLLRAGIAAGAAALIGSPAVLRAEEKKKDAGKDKKKEDDDEGEMMEVTPTEDLMREHGVLNRILLIYEDCIARLESGKDLPPPEVVTKAATLVRHFVEDYHEKQEENYLFVRFEKANKLTDLTRVLRQQHDAGRTTTERILRYSNLAAINAPDERAKLNEGLKAFVNMYRHHETREDTVLFPALRSIVTPHEFAAIGEDFENNEHKMFGQDGFELAVDQVTQLEKQLGLDDLSKYTPHLSEDAAKQPVS